MIQKDILFMDLAKVIEKHKDLSTNEIVGQLEVLKQFLCFDVIEQVKKQ